jgi:hypothetical protein
MNVTRAPRLSTVMVSSTIIPSWAAAGQHADGLDNMHVLAGDCGDVGRAGELAGEGELEAAGLGDILIAPVNVDDDGLRAVGAGAVRVGQDLRRAGPVDRPPMRRGDTVGQLGVGQERDADPLTVMISGVCCAGAEEKVPACATPARGR